jgi:hypothetical protein
MMPKPYPLPQRRALLSLEPWGAGAAPLHFCLALRGPHIGVAAHDWSGSANPPLRPGARKALGGM